MSEEVTTPTQPLSRQLVCDVLAARENYQYLKGGIDQERKEWEAAHAAQQEAVKVAADVMLETMTRLRQYAVSIYAKTGNKTPFPGVAIRSMTRLQYDAAEALKWARHHDVALSLDKGTFEKIAKVTPPEFVEIIIEPQATIATDLVAALEGTYHD